MSVKNSAGVKFNDNTELIIQAAPDGTVESVYNLSNDTEYVGGGGSASWERLHHEEQEVSTTSTTKTLVTSIDLGAAGYTSDDIIYVHIRDKAGKRSGYFYGNDDFSINPYPVNGATTAIGFSKQCIKYAADVYSIQVSGPNSGYGIYADTISSAGILEIYSQVNSSYAPLIDGAYTIDVYKLSMPSGTTLFD